MKSIPKNECSHGHQHCFHDYRGPIHMVIPDGHILQKCCRCTSTRTIHVDHAHGDQRKWTYDGPTPRVTWGTFRKVS